MKKIILTLIFSIFCSACSLSPSTEHRVSMVVSGHETNPFELLSATSSAPPSAISGFDCFGMNVTGYGIPSINPNDHVDVESILAGSHCAYPGATSALVPVVSGGVLETKVPSGPSRVVQIVGFQSNVGCPGDQPIGNYVAQSEDSFDQLFPGVYEVGRAVVDIFSDVELVISSDYDALNPKEFKDCETGFGPAQIPGLAMWLDAGDPSSLADFGEGGNVTTWIGKSGTASVTALGSPPTYSIANGQNGIPTVEFANGSDHFLMSETNVLGSASTGITVIVVGATGTLSANQTFVSVTNGVTGAFATENHILFEFINGPQRMRAKVFGSAAVAAQSSVPSSVSVFNIHAMVWSQVDSDSVRYYVDGGSEVSTTWGGANALDLAGRIGVGNAVTNAGATVGSVGLSGKISEVIVYDREIGDFDRKVIQCGLGSKYNISLAHSCPP